MINTWPYLRELLAEWKTQQFTKVELRIQNLHRHFGELLDFVTDQSESELDLSPQELAISVAIVALGPGGAPPGPVWTQLGQITAATEFSKDHPTPQDYLELVIAWGCGRGRADEFSGTAGVWQGRWSGAIFALSDMVEESINKTIYLLAQRLDLAHEQRQTGALSPQKIHELTNLIGLELAHNRCSCGRHRGTCRPGQAGRRSCGRLCCRDEHRLSGWNPAACSLQAFAAQAVRGSATADLKTGAFVVGVLYSRLTEDIGLQVAAVEFRVCHMCHRAQLDQLIKTARAGQKTGGLKITKLARKEQTRQPKGLYEAGNCPDCGASPNRTDAYYLARKNWLVIPYNISGGVYKLEKRWRCPACKNLYLSRLAQCPLCDQARPKKMGPTHVWVFSSELLGFKKGKAELLGFKKGKTN